MIIPHIWKNKKCLKPPTRVYTFNPFVPIVYLPVLCCYHWGVQYPCSNPIWKGSQRLPFSKWVPSGKLTWLWKITSKLPYFIAILVITGDYPGTMAELPHGWQRQGTVDSIAQGYFDDILRVALQPVIQGDLRSPGGAKSQQNHGGFNIWIVYG